MKRQNQFLVATKRLYMRVCPSVGPSVGWSVRPSLTRFFFGLLGATNSVYTALFYFIREESLLFRVKGKKGKRLE